MVEYLRFLDLDPRLWAPVQWFVLVCIVMLVIGIITSPGLNKIQKWFFSGLTCLCFGVASLLYIYNPRIGGVAFIAIGLTCVYLGAKLLWADYKSRQVCFEGIAASVMPQSTSVLSADRQAIDAELMPDSFRLPSGIKQLPDQTS